MDMLDKLASVVAAVMVLSALAFYIACSVRVLCAAFAVM